MSPTTLHVITDTDRRGAQVFASDLVHGFNQLGLRTEMVALSKGTTSTLLEGVSVLGERQRSLATLRALRRRMAAVDVTVAHGGATLLACALASLGRRRTRPFVYRQISDTRFWAPTLVRRTRVRFGMWRASHVVALAESSKDTLHTYLGVPAAKVTVVPNGVPQRGFGPASAEQRLAARAALGLPSEPVIALYIGALVPEKGVADVIAAVETIPDVHLAIAGDGPLAGELRSLAAETAAGRVHFLDSLGDVRPAYHAADLVVLASRGGDSMPAVLIEAGLCGLAAVTCPVGAIGDIVVDGVTGRVVTSADVEALTAALRDLAADPQLRSRWGAAAQAHCAANFTIDVVAQRWLAVIERVGAGQVDGLSS